MESASFPLPRDLRWRRLIGVALFLATLWIFRSLAPVLICFVVFERGLGWASAQLERRTNIHRKGVIAALLALGGALVAWLLVVAINKLLPFIQQVRTEGRGWVETVAHGALVKKVQGLLHVDMETLTAGAKGYALTAVGVVTTSAYLALFLFVGFILALLYLFEREEVDAWVSGVSPRGIAGTMMRWLGYVADAIAITVRLQLVVAVVNAVLTLPLLIGLGLPKIPLLFVMVLVCGLLPVVGNVISGIVLCIVAYDAKGFLGVGVFLGVTFLLGKIESYYLSPRLTAQHVKLPGIVLVVSLLLFETVFGFWGLFLSFPALYVASRIAGEWRAEEVRLEAERRDMRGNLRAPPDEHPPGDRGAADQHPL
jgi:predicted PurR-regulated permease PerM